MCPTASPPTHGACCPAECGSATEPESSVRRPKAGRTRERVNEARRPTAASPTKKLLRRRPRAGSCPRICRGRARYWSWRSHNLETKPGSRRTAGIDRLSERTVHCPVARTWRSRKQTTSTAGSSGAGRSTRSSDRPPRRYCRRTRNSSRVPAALVNLTTANRTTVRTTQRVSARVAACRGTGGSFTMTSGCSGG